MKLGERIRVVADGRGMSLNELADAASMPRSQLGRIIKGGKTGTVAPRIDTLARIARALGVSFDYLLLGVDGIEGAPQSVDEVIANLIRLGRLHGIAPSELARRVKRRVDPGPSGNGG